MRLTPSRLPRGDAEDTKGAEPGAGARAKAATRGNADTRAKTLAHVDSDALPHAEPRADSDARPYAEAHAKAAPRPDSAPPLPAARTAVPAPGVTDVAPASRGFLAKATLITAVLTAAGAVLGLARDQALARLFGAGSETDAFLVAWTIPEFASTLLIEDGLAFALVPAFSLALARRAQGVPGDPVRALVGSTLPRLSLAFVAVSALIAGTAPYLVEALAPGLPDPALAVDCTRLTAVCVLGFGLAGYCSAALRAHRRFLAPAAIYVAYNVGIITAMFVLGGQWGVRSAAVGVAVGGALMVVVQLPSFVRELRRKASAVEEPAAGDSERAVTGALVATVLLFALCRQSQTLIERFLASTLDAGAISHLNYAQKVAQIPMTLSMMLCTVTFPVVARALADGDVERARNRVERDLALATCVLLLGASVVIACAPQIVELLFQRGAFTARDTAATADVMRVYALGLLGQTLTGVLVRSYFSAARPSWYPVVAMATGIVATSWIGAWTVGPWGVLGIAAANASGITVTAVVLLAGMGPRSVPIRVRRVLGELSKPVRAAVIATVAGTFVAEQVPAAVPGLAAAGTTAVAVFVLLAWALDAQGVVPALRSVRTLTRRLTHGRTR
ncbi:murein biosynthesis integral membrane protein MurJ [Streptomyces justiciae]|uniref:Lipid II flippase MurJ n=1 Tax=Streptomyces justiciae TaxID=2780140 RepID=A0ABU3M665_9ACTN|nr:lipid II flippase MurJ [Streptomyces justiciae]MDT7847017.1 lipid II flippase MurJ [Streptomyces justiciae]